jgi:hypothetical protein
VEVVQAAEAAKSKAGRRYRSDLKQKLLSLYSRTSADSLAPSSTSAHTTGVLGNPSDTQSRAPPNPSPAKLAQLAPDPTTSTRRSTRQPQRPRTLRDSYSRIDTSKAVFETANKTYLRGSGSKKRSELPRDEKGIWGLVYPCVVDDIMAYLACEPYTHAESQGGEVGDEGRKKGGRGEREERGERGKDRAERGKMGKRPECGVMLEGSRRHKRIAEERVSDDHSDGAKPEECVGANRGRWQLEIW